jgi:hypothetical protein
MGLDGDEKAVIVEEEVSVKNTPVTIAPVANAKPPSDSGFSWIPVGMVSVLVGILAVVLVWLPSSLSASNPR